MDRVRFVLIIGLVQLAVTGCAYQAYSSSYRSQLEVESAVDLPGYDHLHTDFAIYHTSGDTVDAITRDIVRLEEMGYVPIGYTEATGGRLAYSEDALRQHATEQGAHAVLISRSYSHTISGAAPVSVPTTSTTYSTGSATAYGSGGYATAHGSSQSTTYGTKTQYVPYSVNQYKTAAAYFAKVRNPTGLVLSAVPLSKKRSLQTNQGMLVRGVLSGSEAYKQDIFPGDVLLSVDGNAIYSAEDYWRLIDERIGLPVFFTFERGGQILTKMIQVTEYRTSPKVGASVNSRKARRDAGSSGPRH